MNKYIEVIVIVEGKTEQLFVKQTLSKYLEKKEIYLRATQVSKPGQKGGDVTFNRVIKDVKLHLRQRQDTYVSTLVDYYAIKKWPGLEKISPGCTPNTIAEILNNEAKREACKMIANCNVEDRFIPNIAIHEFEAYCFCNSDILSSELGIDETSIKKILDKSKHPEAIDDGFETAPSKRLAKLSNSFSKVIDSTRIVHKIGINAIREKCPVFDNWITQLENIGKQF